MPLANRSIKQQFEGILKDAKILCELEPFVKKWSLEEVLPNFEAITESDNLSETSIANILQNASQSLESNPEKGERTLRKIKEIMAASAKTPGNNNDHNYHVPFLQLSDSETAAEDQYDHEFERTLKALEDVEEMDVVTQQDIEDYVRGLGGKPDGLDLGSTNMQEWRHIFIEHWLYLNQQKEKHTKAQRQNMNMKKEKKAVKNGHINSPRNADPAVCTLPKVNLESHFTTRKGTPKTMVTATNILCAPSGEHGTIGLQSRSSTAFTKNYCNSNDSTHARNTLFPQGRAKSLLTLQKEYESLELMKNRKTASSAMKMRSSVAAPGENKKSPTNNYKFGGDRSVLYGQNEEKQNVKSVNKSQHNEGNSHAPAIKRNIQSGSVSGKLLRPSVRPSSAVPFPIKPGAIRRIR